MRPKITDKDWDKIVQDAFSAGAPEPHFSGRYSARRQSMEEKLAMKEERRNAFQPGLVIATVCALLIAAVPMGLIWYMNHPAKQPQLQPGEAVEQQLYTETEEDVLNLEDGGFIPELDVTLTELNELDAPWQGQTILRDTLHGHALTGVQIGMYLYNGVNYLTACVTYGDDSQGIRIWYTELPEVAVNTLYDLETKARVIGAFHPNGAQFFTCIQASGYDVTSDEFLEIEDEFWKDQQNEEMAEVPDITGYRYEYARKILQQEGFQTEETYAYATDMEAGNVLRTEPPAGMHCAPGSTVTVYVSQGAREEFEMPNCSALTQEQATVLVEYYGLVPEFVNEPSDEQPGTVIAQSITPGTMVKNGDTVTLTVAIAGESE